MTEEGLREYIRSAYDPDDLVNILEIDIETIMDLLWTEIQDKQTLICNDAMIEDEEYE